MKFSIIVPIYKVEKYLRACVDSVLKQSYKDFELILVDDGSPDNCPQICDEYADIDRRVKVLHKQNGGQSSARNAGLEIASGDYVCHIDGDDYLIDENVLEKLALSTNGNPDIVHFKFVEWSEQCGKIAPCYFNYDIQTSGRSLADIYSHLIDKDAYYNSAWSKIIRRDLLIDNNIRFEEGIVGEDNEWYYHVVLSANSLILLDEPLYVYRRRQGSTTTSTSIKNLKDQLYVISKWEKILQNRDNDNRSQVIYGSLAKQYCAAVILYASLNNVPSFYPELKQKSYLLKYSKNKRVVIFRWTKRCVGLKGLIGIIQIYKKGGRI